MSGQVAIKFGKAGLLVGAIGDVFLQILDLCGVGNTGLILYFRDHHPVQSVLQASSLTAFWSAVYGYIDGPEKSRARFILFSALVDLLYRFGHPLIYPSLKEYYKFNNWVASMLYNAITSLLVFETQKRIF